MITRTHQQPRANASCPQRAPLRGRAILFLLAAAGAACTPLATTAQAADPACATLNGRQVRWIVPYSPGGGYDTWSRLIAPHLALRIGVPVVVENVPGAGSIIGALRVRNAAPDGLTVGIVNAPALLVASLLGESEAPNPLRDFTILGRASRSRHVWATGGRSPLRTMDDVFARARGGPIVFAVDEVTSSGFVGAVLAAPLLGVDVAFVSGFAGSRENTMAAVRGEVDLVSVNFDSGRDRIESGDLRPLLQISDTPIAGHPSLAKVPLFAGPGGLAARRANPGRDREEATADARAVAAIVGAGRIVVGPPGLPAPLFACLEGGLRAAAADPAFLKQAAAAERSVDTAPAAVASDELALVRERAPQFLPLLRAAVERARR